MGVTTCQNSKNCAFLNKTKKREKKGENKREEDEDRDGTNYLPDTNYLHYAL